MRFLPVQRLIYKLEHFLRPVGNPDDPIRAELFSLERLEQHAESLAAAQRTVPRKTHGTRILPRVKANARVLTNGYRTIVKAMGEERSVTPAGEWLVDNFHIVEEQIREIIDDLPPAFYRELPKLADGHLRGYPRVFAVAWAFIAHTDSRFDSDWLRRFVRAYQKRKPLLIGELWALAISLRIVLVENLRRIAEHIVVSKTSRALADTVADALLGLKGQAPARPEDAFAPFAGHPLPQAFAVQLVQRLRDQEGRVTEALHWLDEKLAEEGTTAERIVQREHEIQTAMNTTVRNIITSMRLLSAMDWAKFFEDVSTVDDLLRERSAFASMDFSTRDLYRHAIEALARRSGLTELDVTGRVLHEAQKAGASGDADRDAARRRDPGYYLIADGRYDFEKRLGARISLRHYVLRAYMQRATPAYLGTIFLAAAIFLAVPLWQTHHAGAPHWTLLLFGLLGLIPATDLAIAAVNRFVADWLKPQRLPKLDFSTGIPEDRQTLIVIPTLLTNADAVSEQIESLEIHYLSNPDKHLQFALLTDWADAAQESTDQDQKLLALARRGIRELNDRHREAGRKERFSIFHRRRLWNEKENVWMGWERKRGKLQELNHLLRGATNTSFLAPGAVPAGIRYVLTLDADTRMPHGAAYRLIGAMAHPLNQALFDQKSGRVIKGYGIMQPRVTPTLPSVGSGSLFQKAYSGPCGIDPYAFAVSDVYQDLFKEGSYIGKGIYDIDAFEASLAGRVPDNKMLSHDLFEGLYARTALVTDVEVFEDFPSHYEVAVARSHRWIRGDWQLLPFIAGPQLTVIGRWKMIDNLRRALSTPSLFAALLCLCFLSSPSTVTWAAFFFATLALPPLLPVLLNFLTRPGQRSLASHLRNVGADLQLALTQILLSLIFMAYAAWVQLDAVLRSLYRMGVSRRNLLEWQTAALSKNLSTLDLSAFFRDMKVAPIVALAALVGGVTGHAASPPLLGWLVFWWTLSPWIAQRISLPVRADEAGLLPEADQIFFRRIARKTWRFFETFVSAEHHFLPPDNFQEIPKPVVAHRTSPTNIGIYMLSVVAAQKFGWIGLEEAAERLEATLGSVKTLSRHEGHLFNWYDTLDKRPLEPLYISTVDSGNFAGHLWTIASACRKWAAALPGSPKADGETWAVRLNILQGFDDAARLVEEKLPANSDVKPRLAELRRGFRIGPSGDWSTFLMDLQQKVTELSAGSDEDLINAWELLLRQIASHHRDADDAADPVVLAARFTALARDCDEQVEAMKFGFLYDAEKNLFSIGFQLAEQKLDPSYYDLLASEARLASFVAIAKGDVPSLHWFHLSRPLSAVGSGPALLSWSGSMFEYLMPSLVMRPPLGSLLDQTCRNVVRRQIDYGEERGVPWGVSEAGYNAQDLEYTYQYSNFGVPGLGLKRGLGEDLLIAPYATALAAMVDPPAAAANLNVLSKIGAEGAYGFYESLDYTATRLPEDQTVAVVKEYMAHHQGMSLLAITNVLYDSALCKDFHADLRVQATELLLQERTPRDTRMARARLDDVPGDVHALVPLVLRRFTSAHEKVPRTHLLSNGRYSVMITTAGSGYSWLRDMAVTRWREDTTRDAWGAYFFIRDVESGAVWSAGLQPSGVEPDRYEVDFSEDRAEIVRQDGTFITKLEVVVSPEDDAEIRRVTLQNTGVFARDIEVTSYAEVVLAPPAADRAHPAFSNLFVKTEFVRDVNGLICTRRPRAPEEQPVWAAHVVVVDGETIGELQYESDRSRFLGRGRGIRTPQSVIDGGDLSNTTGAVLDPILSLRRRVRVEPGKTVRVLFTTLVASTREEAILLADKYHDLSMFERTVTLAWTRAHIQQHYLGIEPSEAHLFQDLTSRIFYAEPGLRPVPAVLERNVRGVSGLWAHGISGDLPIVLLRIDDEEARDIARELLRAHEYWRMKNLAVDLVILNEQASSYAQGLQAALENLVRTSRESGRVFVLRSDRLAPEDKVLLLTAARVILLSRQGTLAEQIERLEAPPERPLEETALSPKRIKNLFAKLALPGAPRLPEEKELQNLHFFNGLGGFSDDGREYVTILAPKQWAPAPWINVISNGSFGFQVSEMGAGYTWSMNSRENQLTSWSNDPVSDPACEIFYLRDEDTGDLWTPTALPIRRESSSYVARHGQGYSRFSHTSFGITSDLLQFVPVSDSVKISRLTLTNMSKRSRKISVTAYVEWVLGTQRAASAPYIVTDVDSLTGSIVARNRWNEEFAERVAFAHLEGDALSWTADRAEFIGRNGTLDHPSAMEHLQPLSGRVGAGLDPCAAMQATVELRAGARVDVIFLLGQTASVEEARALIERYRRATIDDELEKVHKSWENNLRAVQVRTPDRAMDFMLNHWLLYQTLACRLWARAAFYQAGGAFGFRDQLQDVMALTVSRRDLAREQILRAAARQFPPGDVQHWWHPPTGRGVRTRISDDLLWLPYVVNHYLEVTGDSSILDEKTPFLEGQEIPPEREDAYFNPKVSAETATLFEHCARALDHSLQVGAHGLPLMGSGDWNDGMNRVGREGKGESVWLAWFLHTTLWEFAKVADHRGETARAEKWRLHVGELKAAIERNGWDGSWYRRAYFDDGSPLGSSGNSECRIDSIAQSWGVLSGAADPSRAAQAMSSLEHFLVRRNDSLVLLLTPPFDQMKPSPGYIEGYLPGVRENGGQYTHAAAWAVLAFAALGDGDKATELFSMLNPIHHGSTPEEIQRYKVEPYVVAGDVYSEAPHTGRGGWSWYTGSAGWLYRAGIEWILGCRLRETTLFMDPCIPKSWRSFELSFRYHSARYEVKVENPNGVSRGIVSAEVDGRPVRGGAAILLTDDGKAHDIRILMGKS